MSPHEQDAQGWSAAGPWLPISFQANLPRVFSRAWLTGNIHGFTRLLRIRTSLQHRVAMYRLVGVKESSTFIIAFCRQPGHTSAHKSIVLWVISYTQPRVSRSYRDVVDTGVSHLPLRTTRPSCGLPFVRQPWKLWLSMYAQSR